MKTAVSIPDKLFRKAEKLAKKLGLSRSQFFAQAIERRVNEESQSEITRRLNEAYPGGAGSELDPALKAASMRTLREATKDDTW